MSSFKVVCKANGNDWVQNNPSFTKIVTSKRFFGLIKTSSVIPDTKKVPGPTKEEVCIVTDEYTHDSTKWYVLAGYPYGGYNSRYFVRIDEFMETEKEIWKKQEPVLN